MKIYDISQEVFSCEVYPGDPAPLKKSICSIVEGNPCNLTEFSMCAHNGTHIDAPYHFLNDGKKIDEIDLSKCTGFAFVTKHDGIVTANDAKTILQNASLHNPEAAKRILIGGNAVISLDAAKVFADAKIDLIGNESQTVGPEDSPMEVHRLLLGAEVVLLEGIRLADVSCGVYLLSAAPLSLGGSDGSPCRAVLIEL
ncbi:MAG: cyclase [Ruminococcaceae bacterium]|nr:cyclase [Oscillospiraceae bacterium]